MGLVTHADEEMAADLSPNFPPLKSRVDLPGDLPRYLAKNTDSLIDYGERYRSKLPISTSRAEGCVDEIANARMAKKQRMSWSPQDAHRMATVRAAVLDGRLKEPVGLPLAA